MEEGRRLCVEVCERRVVEEYRDLKRDFRLCPYTVRLGDSLIDVLFIAFPLQRGYLLLEL